MFIRSTLTRRSSSGDSYTTHRLVKSVRQGDTVRQVTLMNLGRHFPVPKDTWPALCERIKALVAGSASPIPVALDEVAETEAQRIAAHLVAARADADTPVAAQAVPARPATAEPDLANTDPGKAIPDAFTIDVNSVEMLRPRSVGLEQVALHVMDQLGLDALLSDAGLNGIQRATATALIIGRMARPGSERSTHRWITQQTGLGELIDVDLGITTLEQLHRTLDRLGGKRPLLQDALFDRIAEWFGLAASTPLHDLTNTCVKQLRVSGRDATFGMVIDGSGFLRRSELFPGSVAEPKRLQIMLEKLIAPTDAIVLVNQRAFSADSIDWLIETGRNPITIGDALSDHDADMQIAQPMLRDLHAVFRSLQVASGLRSMTEPAMRRASGYLQVCVLAYQLIQVIRRLLAASGLDASWNSLRQQLGTQVRVTTRLRRNDGRAVHLRRAVAAEPALHRIYEALGIDASPGEMQVTVV